MIKITKSLVWVLWVLKYDVCCQKRLIRTFNGFEVINTKKARSIARAGLNIHQ